ncbi:mRNA 3' end processing factor [Marasmius tenuissimus]|nr:mRNA 3' end processing factor [Marasmius tenuissimus]
MVELVLTWRTGSPTGKELFGVPAQVSIERSIWGEGSNSVRNHRRTRKPKTQAQRSQQSRFNSSGQVTKGQVLSELEFTLGQKERALQCNPADAVAQNHVAVLQQLKRLVEAGVSQEELVQILSQLRSLMRTATQPSPPPQHQPQPVAAPSWPAPATFTTPPPVIPSIPTIQSVSPPKTEVPTPSSMSAISPVPAAGFADLLSSLLKSGVVSANGTPLGAGSTQAEEAVDYERETSRSYRASILDHTVQLSTVGLTRSKPPMQSLLYDRLSLQCKQCGVRFLDTASGKKELEDHLDMHFRQNLKANQNIGRGHSRSWFIGVEDWIHDVSDIKGKGCADHRPLNPKAAAAAEAVKRDAELRSQFVVVPPGDESKTISCPVCKEVLSPEFVEDEEEWVWKNAIKKDDRIYHATCHAEASSNTLVARLRTDVSSRSRSGTPERVFQPKQQTPPRGLSSSPESKLAGIKRKVDDNDTLSEPEGTPRLKKMALAPS